MQTTAKFDDSNLRAQVRRLALSSSRTIPQVLNQTSLNAIGRATNETPRADKVRIRTQLGQFVKANRILKAGKNKGQVRASSKLLTVNFFRQGPRLALIINARRRKAGLKALEGPAMEREMSKLLRVRLFSEGFERSGWFAGMRELITAIKATGKSPFIIAQMRGIATVGQAKGDAKAASKSSFYPKVEVGNHAKGIVKIGSQALQNGMNKEAAEINRHLEEDLKPEVLKFNEESKR